MFKEKYIPHLALGTMSIVVLLVIALFTYSMKSSLDQVELVQPEYMTKIFDKEQIVEINIQIDESDWEALKENASQELYYPADLTVNGETYYNVGIRAKGNSSLSMVASDDTTDRYSFKIKMDEYQEQNIYGLTKFVLNNNIGDATSMKEYLAYDMLAEMGIAVPGYAYAHITLNGEEWGLYLAVESLEESFVERNFGHLDGNLYKVESSNMNGQGGPGGFPEGMSQMPFPGQDGKGRMPFPSQNQEGEVPPQGQSQEERVVSQEQNQEGIMSSENQDQEDHMRKGPGMGSMGNGANLVYTDDEISSYTSIFDYTILKTTTDQDKKNLIGIIKNLNEGVDLEDSIDIEQVLKYFAVNTFLVNLDSYAGNMKHNYYLYEENGKIQILPWDYNLSFGAFMINDASEVVNFPIDKPVTDTMENSPLIAKLLEVDEYRALYHGYLQELINRYIKSGKFEETVNKLNTLINEYVKNDATAFFEYEAYEAAWPNLLIFANDRTTSIEAQLAGEQPTKEYGNIETTLDLEALGNQGGILGEKKGGFKMPTEGANHASTPEMQDGFEQGNKGPREMNPFDHMKKNEEQEVEKADQNKKTGILLIGILIGGFGLISGFGKKRFCS